LADRCGHWSHSVLFFFNPPAPTETYTLSLHDALPISYYGGGTTHALPHLFYVPVVLGAASFGVRGGFVTGILAGLLCGPQRSPRSEEHTSELQSRENLVCRLLLEKKKRW